MAGTPLETTVAAPCDASKHIVRTPLVTVELGQPPAGRYSPTIHERVLQASACAPAAPVHVDGTNTLADQAALEIDAVDCKAQRLARGWAGHVGGVAARELLAQKKSVKVIVRDAAKGRGVATRCRARGRRRRAPAAELLWQRCRRQPAVARPAP